MGNNVLYNLFDYGNEYNENISTKEQVARNSLSVIDTPINERFILRQDFDIFEDGKRLNNLKNSRRNNFTLIINAAESINDREFEIDKLSRKRDIFSNNDNKIRKHKNNLKSILKECPCNRNKKYRGLEDKINMLLHEYDMKREVCSVVSVEWSLMSKINKTTYLNNQWY